MQQSVAQLKGLNAPPPQSPATLAVLWVVSVEEVSFSSCSGPMLAVIYCMEPQEMTAVELLLPFTSPGACIADGEGE